MFNYSLENANSIAPTPKAFIINEIFLYTNSGEQINLQDLLQNIFINESIYQSGISVEIFLKDNIGLINDLRLSGNEQIKLKISRREPFNSGSRLKGYQLDLFVMEIKDYSRTRPSEVAYTLECVSKHVYLNNKKLLSRSFNGNIADLIRSIVESDLNSNLTVEAAAENIKGIYPYIQPLSGISWLLRNAFDNGMPFYFYESPQYGLIFTSYKKILDTYKDNPHRTYNNFPMLGTSISADAPIDEAFDEEKNKIFQIKSNLNVSKLNAGAKGAFKSVLNKIDISNKSKIQSVLTGDRFKTDWEYTFDGNKTLNNSSPINPTMTINDEQLLDFRAVKHHYISYNGLAYSNTYFANALKNYHNPTDMSILEAEGRKHNLDTLKQEIVIAGDFDLTCGTIVNLQLLKNDDVSIELENNKNIEDDILSGKHLVTAVRHQFGANGYTMSVALKKDSFILRNR